MYLGIKSTSLKIKLIPHMKSILKSSPHRDTHPFLNLLLRFNLIFAVLLLYTVLHNSSPQPLLDNVIACGISCTCWTENTKADSQTYLQVFKWPASTKHWGEKRFSPFRFQCKWHCLNKGQQPYVQHGFRELVKVYFNLTFWHTQICGKYQMKPKNSSKR